MGKLFRPLVFFITFLIMLITEILRRRREAPSSCRQLSNVVLFDIVYIMFLSLLMRST